MKPFCRGRCIHILFTFIYLRFMNIFIVWKMKTHNYLHLYILGYEPFCRGR